MRQPELHKRPQICPLSCCCCSWVHHSRQELCAQVVHHALQLSQLVLQ